MGSRAEGERERSPQADSLLSEEPDEGLSPRTLKSEPEPESRVGRSMDWTSEAPRTPLILALLHESYSVPLRLISSSIK